MNLFKKIGVAFVGMAMAIGVGVAVGGTNKKTLEVRATDPVAGDAPLGTSGNWLPIESTSDINETDFYMFGYDVSGTQYFNSSVSSNKFNMTDTFASAKMVQFVETGDNYNIKLSSTNFLRNPLSSSKASGNLTSTDSSYSAWSLHAVGNGTDFYFQNEDGNLNDGRILARASESGGAALKTYVSGNVPGTYPYVTIYKYVESVPDTVTKNAASFTVDLGKTLNLNSCVTATGTSELTFSAPAASNEYFTIVGSTLTPLKVGGPYTITATKGSASDTFDVSVVMPLTKIVIDGTTFTEITGSSYDTFSHTYNKLNDLGGGVTASTTIQVDQAYPNAKSIQMSKSKTHTLKNTTAVPGHINNIVISFTNASASEDVSVATAGTPNVYAKASSEASSSDTKLIASTSGNTATYSFTGDDYKFFYVDLNPTASTIYFSVVVNYEKSYEDNAKDFSSEFISNLSSACSNENANNESALLAEQTSGKTLWAEQKEAFETLSTKAKEKFSSSSDATIVRARTLYLHCVARYGLSTWTGAPAAQAARVTFTSDFVKESSATTVIIIVSVVGLIAIGGYFVIRRRKEY